MLDQASARHAGAKFTVVGLCIQGLEKCFLGCDQRPFQFQKIGLEKDGVNAACVECNGVRCCFQSVSIMALLLSEQSGFEGPCLSALAVKRQAPLVGFKRQFFLALRFQKLSVLKPIGRTARIFLERLEDGFDGFRARPCTGAARPCSSLVCWRRPSIILSLR